ncbi:hypothetical protein AX769_12285 [Frondihabitans sp. PAMC 28766]|uniref:TetR/AcrR family transcriptional regulator n=1 Tax=Frondihabitans sp. PAMC 28766 TaxID=1795630 RepID=UPI00078D7EB6|nr:TetR/AcrR family transcriptional regulator [Frondihabitans sp. PAMC 28766]AMM20776.1 hypothetical protein AX769_12285 [Frondihabitans sp. PAMC 28766]
MTTDPRRSMVIGAARLLAERGLQETSFSEVLKLTGAPRGSIYHHFPDGKDQLVAEAVDLAGAHAIRLIEQSAGKAPVEIVRDFIAMWRAVLVHSDFQAGCSVVAVTVASDSPDLLAHAANVFRAWRARLAELLAAAGLAPADADRFAALLIASTEGAVVMSRAEQSLDPFELVADQLLGQVPVTP